MKIELMPVLEIAHYHQGIPAPDKFPYWENTEVWDQYHAECYAKAGFQDPLPTYMKGSCFCKLSEITDLNLSKLVIDHTQELRDGIYERDQACAFFGGYVLRVDGKDMYFPQCCGELSDIRYWEELSNGNDAYYEGHPAPVPTFDMDSVTLDFSVREYDEIFQPPPPKTVFTIDRHALRNAVENVKKELLKLEMRLERINYDARLKIENIGGLLIYGNPF